MEHILDRKLTAREHTMIRDEVLSHMLLREQALISDCFDCPISDRDRLARVPRRIPLPVRKALRHLRALVKIYLPVKESR